MLSIFWYYANYTDPLNNNLIKIYVLDRGAPITPNNTHNIATTPPPNLKRFPLNKDNKAKSNKQPKHSTSITHHKSGTGGNHGTTTMSVTQNYQKYIDYRAPIYPKNELLLDHTGIVIIRMRLEKNQITSIEIYQKSKYNKLNESALEAAKHWHLKQNVDQAIWIEVAVHFIIK